MATQRWARQRARLKIIELSCMTRSFRIMRRLLNVAITKNDIEWLSVAHIVRQMKAKEQPPDPKTSSEEQAERPVAVDIETETDVTKLPPLNLDPNANAVPRRRCESEEEFDSDD